MNEISLTGVETDVHAGPGQSIRALGLTLTSPPSAPTTRPANPTTQPVPVVVASANTPTQDVAALLDAARRPLPLFTLDKLDLNIARASLHNDNQPDAAPITLADFQLRNNGRVEVGGADPQSRPPIQLQLTGKVDPIAGQFAVNAKIAPMAQEPSLIADLSTSGFQGDGLLKIEPQLKPQIDGASMTDGRGKSHVEVVGKFARIRPGQYDFTKPFDLDLTIAGSEFRSGPDSPILGGLENLHADSIHVDPQTGAVHIKTLELTKPMGNVWRDKAGVHALGWTVKLPATTQPSATQPTTTQPAVADAKPAPATENPAPTPGPLPPEIRIDSLQISGLDFRIEDRSVEPNMIIPLNGLDLDVRNISNLALYEDRPIRFTALVTSGNAPLPSVKKGARDDATDQREVFSQIAANGNVSLYPKPTGYAKAAVNGFEMVALRGLAHDEKVTIGKGVFDGNVDLRLPGDNTVDVRSKFVLTDTEITEPAGGLLQRTLKLPGSLDVVIKVLQDTDESITVPLSFPVKSAELSYGPIIGAAVGAFGQVVVTAIASAPVKVVDSVVGLLGAKNGPKPEPPVELIFQPGVTGLSPSDQSQLDQVIKKFKKDENLELIIRHDLGTADIQRAAIRANPTPQECTSLAYQLHSRKLDLLAHRANLSGQVKSILASAPTARQSASAVSDLRDLDHQIAQTEDALDKVYDLLRPGADRQSARRTRAASLDLAQERLTLVRNYLLTTNIESDTDRIHSTNPTFTQPESDSPGKITINLIVKKKQ